jgi:hypothetical protein
MLITPQEQSPKFHFRKPNNIIVWFLADVFGKI